MTTRLAAVALAITCAIPASARADDKEDVAAATTRWADAFSRDDPDAILALYDKDAVLWGTSSATRRDNPEQIRSYFASAFARLHGRKVSVTDQLIRVYGDIAINTGSYNFHFVNDGAPKESPARFTFVFRRHGQQWLIVDHHSSAVPPAPK